MVLEEALDLSFDRLMMMMTVHLDIIRDLFTYARVENSITTVSDTLLFITDLTYAATPPPY